MSKEPPAMDPNAFVFSDEREPHLARTKAILKEHPELRKYIGTKNPWTFLVLLIGVSLQFSIAWFMGRQAWWVAALTAFFIGTVINHSFIAIVHEASHNLIFRNRVANMLAGVLVNLPMFIPSYVSFKKYHMKHHAFQGIYELDADFPSQWEAKLVKNVWWRKLLWISMFPLVQSLRPGRVKEVNFLDGWVLFNIAAVFAADFAVFHFWGPTSLLYLGLSMWLGFGLSIVGGRLIQEHFMVAPPQETYSYYGILNLPSLNVGYHNEHHDLPSVPWNHLPKIRKTARKYYDDMLVHHNSWGKLMLRFLFDKNISMYSRVIRSNRGKTALNAPVRPDMEMMQSAG